MHTSYNLFQRALPEMLTLTWEAEGTCLGLAVELLVGVLELLNGEGEGECLEILFKWHFEELEVFLDFCRSALNQPVKSPIEN